MVDPSAIWSVRVIFIAPSGASSLTSVRPLTLLGSVDFDISYFHVPSMILSAPDIPTAVIAPMIASFAKMFRILSVLLDLL
jgi:hypothetical protein